MRIVEELKEKPTVILLENVKNFYTHDDGNTFAKVFEELEAAGYCVWNKVLNTSAITKIPQNRQRTFLVCFNEGSGPSDPSKKLSWAFKQKFSNIKEVKKTDSFRKFLEKKEVDPKFFYTKDKSYYIKNTMYGPLKKTMKSKDTVYQWRRVYVRENKSNECPTLTANMGTGGHNVPLIITEDNKFRKLTPKECLHLQGFPKWYKFPDSVSTSQRYKQVGNSVTVPVIKILAGLIKQSLDTRE